MRSFRQEWLGLWTENGSPRQDLQIGADGSVIRSREEVFFVGIDCRWGHVGVIKRFVGWEVTSLCYPDGCVYGEFDNWRGPECGERFWMFDKDEFYCPDVISTIRGAALHAVLHVQRAFRRRRAQASLPARAKKARHGSHRCCGAGVIGMMAHDARRFCVEGVISTMRGPAFQAVRCLQRAFRRRRYLQWYRESGGWDAFVQVVVAFAECRGRRAIMRLIRKVESFCPGPSWGYVPVPAPAVAEWPGICVPALDMAVRQGFHDSAGPAILGSVGRELSELRQWPHDNYAGPAILGSAGRALREWPSYRE